MPCMFPLGCNSCQEETKYIDISESGEVITLICIIISIMLIITHDAYNYTYVHTAGAVKQRSALYCPRPQLQH